jgi:hypothetical protein
VRDAAVSRSGKTMRRARSSLRTTMLRAAAAAAAFVSSACADDVPTLVSGGESASGSSTASSSGSSSTSTASSLSTGPADDTTGTTGTTGTASTGEPEVIFLPEPDLGSLSYECDIFTQDCPSDQKCMPWANDGGGSWNAWGCKPLVDDPVGIDEVCHVQGSGTSGIDDCEIGAMCWYLDPDTDQGVCTPLCVNTEQDPLCDDPQRQCRTASDSIVWLCLPSCNPIAQGCPRGQACYPIAAYWECAGDASGGGGAYGEPCEFTNVCDPGLVCLDVSYVPPGLPCEGAGHCCTEVCDVDDPLGDLQCAGAAEGQTCQPWYEEGEAPPEYEDVGVCAMPQ